MKAQTIIALLLIVSIANATSIGSLFQGSKSKSQTNDFDALMASKSKQVSLNKYLFKQADVNKDGYLSLEEFAAIYEKFIQSVAKKAAPKSLIVSRFNMADHIVKDNRLSFKEFVWLVGSDLSFCYSNDNYGTGASSVLINLLNKINGIYKNIVFQSLYKLFTGKLDRKSVSFEKFKSIIKWLPQTIKLKLDWSDCVLRGYYQLADADGNGILTMNEVDKLVEQLLNDLFSIMQCYKTK